jgi:beta-barrel assembly-enhancing protease
MRRPVFFIAALAVLGCAGMPGISLESMTRVGAAALPIGPDKEREIGFGIAATVAGRYRLVNDPELTTYVNLVGLTVAEQSIRKGEVEFRFGVLDTDDVNAFAAPGGYVFITRGALALMGSEAELAGVLAHEIGHVDEKQVLDEIRRADVLKNVRDESGLTGPILDRIAELGASRLFMGLSREDELQADSVGLLYATATGYRPDGLLRFLQALHAAELADADGVQEWKSTHPSTAERIERLGAQVAAAGARGGVEEVERFRRFVRVSR